VSHRERQRLADIQAAIDAIHSHLQRGDLSDGLVFDAVRIRLLEIGEAVKALPEDLLVTQPSIPWRQIARMRDHLRTAPSSPSSRAARANNSFGMAEPSYHPRCSRPHIMASTISTRYEERSTSPRGGPCQPCRLQSPGATCRVNRPSTQSRGPSGRNDIL
jgi:hypothetical protein